MKRTAKWRILIRLVIQSNIGNDMTTQFLNRKRPPKMTKMKRRRRKKMLVQPRMAHLDADESTQLSVGRRRPRLLLPDRQ
jgi:hypothetical protein